MPKSDVSKDFEDVSFPEHIQKKRTKSLFTMCPIGLWFYAYNSSLRILQKIEKKHYVNGGPICFLGKCLTFSDQILLKEQSLKNCFAQCFQNISCLREKAEKIVNVAFLQKIYFHGNDMLEWKYSSSVAADSTNHANQPSRMKCIIKMQMLSQRMKQETTSCQIEKWANTFQGLKYAL